MTARGVPTFVTHFTHVEHLPTLIKHGLLSDTKAQGNGLLAVEVGNVGIKDQRRQRGVPVPPGGMVSDYVPFYFAPRSPMMYSLSRGNVPTYQGGTARLIYLVSSLEALHGQGHDVILTDRNAALGYAGYRVFDPSDLVDDGFIDWDLMSVRQWSNTSSEPQRVERRMAECLVFGAVPWSAVLQIVVQNKTVEAEVRAALGGAGVALPVDVVSDWYF